MRKKGIALRSALVLAAAAALAAFSASGARATHLSGQSLTGAGSTFVQPLVNRWITPVQHALHISLTYSGVGSTAGVASITNRQSDMGMSDAPLSKFATTCNSCVQMPWALAGTAAVYNLSNFPYLHMSGPVLAKIYLGIITNWNDPAIKALNPGKHLPNLPIQVFYRSDGSGTTFNFTDFLSKTSNAWQNGPGTGTSVSWPVGTGESHSSGVAGAVAAQRGGIGYVDVYYAKSNGLQYFDMENEAGKFVQPTLASIKAASKADQTPSNSSGLNQGTLSIVDPPSNYPNAYPICTYTYVDVQQSGNGSQAGVIKKFLNWAITKGQSYGPSLLFAPLPSGVVTWDQNNAINSIHS